MVQPEARSADAWYFQMHGLVPRAPADLNESLRSAVAKMHRTLYAPSSRELTNAEIAVLRAAGADLDDHPDRPDPMLEYAVEFGAILATGLTVTGVSRRLAVTTARVRQLIGDRALFAFRNGSRWVVPAYQLLEERGLVPNVAKVNRAIPEAVDPVSVNRWFVTPDAELAVEDKAISPLAWLKAGMDPDVVARLARDL